jgi:hypothetical protein
MGGGFVAAKVSLDKEAVHEGGGDVPVELRVEILAGRVLEGG